MWQTAMQHFNVLTLEKWNFHFSWFKIILKIYAPHSSTWNYTSTPTYAFMACTGTNLLLLFQRGQFSLQLE